MPSINVCIFTLRQIELCLTAQHERESGGWESVRERERGRQREVESMREREAASLQVVIILQRASVEKAHHQPARKLQ